MLIELKYGKDVNSTLAQIRRQEYPDRLVHYRANILLVSINYDRDVPNNRPKFRHHTCSIERA